MSHDERVRREFARQSHTIPHAAPFLDAEILEALAAASGAGPGLLLLDHASGPGIVAEELALRGATVEAVDLTPEMVEKTRARASRAGLSSVTAREGDAAMLPFGDAHFDSVISRLAFHHFGAPREVAAELFRVLKPGGRLAVADIVASPDPERAALHNALETLRDPSHARMFPETELLALFHGAGFEAEVTARWARPRRLGEWADIAAAPERAGPLAVVMSELVVRGADAGIGLRLEAGEPAFDHHWVLIEGRRPA